MSKQARRIVPVLAAIIGIGTLAAAPEASAVTTGGCFPIQQGQTNNPGFFVPNFSLPGSLGNFVNSTTVANYIDDHFSSVTPEVVECIGGNDGGHILPIPLSGPPALTVPPLRGSVTPFIAPSEMNFLITLTDPDKNQFIHNSPFSPFPAFFELQTTRGSANLFNFQTTSYSGTPFAISVANSDPNNVNHFTISTNGPTQTDCAGTPPGQSCGVPGDETSDVKASAGAPKWSPPAIQLVYSDSSGDLNLMASMLATAGNAPFAATLKVLGGVGATLADLLGKASLIDPVDANFQTVVLPTTPTLNLSGLLPSVQVLLQDELQAIGLLQAMITTSNRATGAYMAGDNASMSLQLTALAIYESELAPILQRLQSEYAAVQVDLAALGVDFSSITAADIASFLQSIGQNGLPAGFLAILAGLGDDQATISDITTNFLDLDPTQVLGLTAGGLNDPQIGADTAPLADFFSPENSGPPPSTSVPEPASLVLFGTAVIGFSALRRRIPRPVATNGRRT